MANPVNQLTIEGNLVRDPLLKTTGKGVAICTFSIANNYYYKRGDGFESHVSYFDVECWSNLAYEVQNSLHKGNAVEITGRLKQDRWTGQDGRNNSKIIIVANTVKPISRERSYDPDPYRHEETPQANRVPF